MPSQPFTPSGAPDSSPPDPPDPSPPDPTPPDPAWPDRAPTPPDPAPHHPADRRRVAVFDLDGVLADVRHRLHHLAHRPKDWDAFFAAAVADPPLPEGLAAVAEAARTGHAIVYLTGRPERCRADTLEWLAAHGLPDGQLFMRDDTDRRPARFTKVARLRRLAREAEIAVLVDDDAAVVESVRSAGFPVLHATWMGEQPSPSTSGSGLSTHDNDRAVLFEAQEGEGRT